MFFPSAHWYTAIFLRYGPPESVRVVSALAMFSEIRSIRSLLAVRADPLISSEFKNAIENGHLPAKHYLEFPVTAVSSLE